MKEDNQPQFTTNLSGVTENDPNITEGKKHYIFSATGNIMIASTDADSSNLDDKVRDVFNEVSVFYAAMSKAITTTQRPGKKECYSLYDYEALEKVIDGSGCFIHCTQEDINYSSTSVGADFSKELLTALLGLPAGGGALSFAQAMISSMGQEGFKMSIDTTSTESKVGNIIFVCEFLFGMPVISAMVVYVDTKKNSDVFKAGPCVSVTNNHTSITMHKDVYMFVTPAFIKSYASDLDSIITSSDYSKFIAYLRSLLTDDIVLEGVYEGDKLVEGNTLTKDTEYSIKGNNFGDEQGTLSLGGNNISINGWNNQEVVFSISEATQGKEELKLATKKGKSLSIGNYEIVEGK